MKNLTDSPTVATEAFRVELARCGIDAAPAAKPSDVGVTIEGAVDLPGGFTLRVERRWCYAEVRITPALPFDAANEINETRHVEDGSHYSAHNGKLGGLARVHGYAGGLFGDRLRSYSRGFVRRWHADALGALAALVATTRAVIERRGLTAEDARRAYVRATTDAWLDECGEVLRSHGVIADAVRENLHDNPDLDDADPRIVKLRAEFPRETAS